MNESIKQAMHLDACKSFGAAEANENERRWDDKMIDSKNNDSINNYDKTRMRLNFEIGPDGKIHSLGYQDKRLDVRLQERLNELGWQSIPRSFNYTQSYLRTLLGISQSAIGLFAYLR